MEALIVTARLRNGFSSNDPWSPSLDGILAYYHLLEQLGEEEFALGMSDPTRLATPRDLPLQAEVDGEQWWYCCSSPIYEQVTEFQKWFHRRFDVDLAMRYLAGKTARVAVSSGPFKNYRLNRVVHVTREVVYHAIGDGDEIRRLLRRCDWIGASRGQGLGRVDGWGVETGGDEQIARYWRPLPVEYGTAHAVEGTILEWGIRPPGRLRENKTLCVLPVQSA